MCEPLVICNELLINVLNSGSWFSAVLAVRAYYILPLPHTVKKNIVGFQPWKLSIYTLQYTVYCMYIVQYTVPRKPCIDRVVAVENALYCSCCNTVSRVLSLFEPGPNWVATTGDPESSFRRFISGLLKFLFRQNHSCSAAEINFCYI